MRTCIVLLVFLSQCAPAQMPPAGVCFSPDERCELPLATFIGNAKKTLDVAIYDINEPGIVAAVLAASARGVLVRMVCDKTEASGPHSAIRMLAAKIPLRYGHQRGIMHNKFTVVDGQALETGSFNYTVHASGANQENQLYTTDPEVLARYQARFEKIWAGATPVTAAAPASVPHSPKAAGIPSRP